MKNISIKNFTAPCDELSQEIKNYAVIRDNDPKKHLSFGNIQIDNQIILAANEDNQVDENYIKHTIDGCDSCYPDSVVYFFPKNYTTQVKSIIEDVVKEWETGKSTKVGYSLLGDIYIATKETTNGIWVFTYDSSTSVAFQYAQNMFSEHIKIEDLKASTTNKNPFVVYVCEESSGEYFLQYLKKKKALVPIMKEENLYPIKLKINKTK